MLNNNRGVAILIAIFSMILAITIATEISYETQVEYISASQGVKRLKAYYAAKSGVELALLRILIYKKAEAKFGSQLGAQKSMLDMIWKFPYAWPPVGTEMMDTSARSAVNDVVKESQMDAEVVVNISGEGGRIDINDLGAESDALRNGVRVQLLQIFENELENNKDFQDKYDNFNFEDLVGNIQDWVDADKTAASGRSSEETSLYEQPKDGSDISLPPNTPFKTVEELHMVAEMQDDLYELLKDKITVFGSKGINVNTAESAILKSIHPMIKDEILSDILQRRNDPKIGPFQNDDEFFGYLNSKGINTESLRESKIPLLYDAEHNFRVTSIGRAADVVREITVITYDVVGLTTRYVEILDEQDKISQSGGGQPTPTPTPSSTPNKPAATKKMPKGRPTVVYWQET